MEKRIAFCRGCLLGMASGDALGFAVDAQPLEQILENYGPNGLMGYDPSSDYAQLSSHTQLAALTGNGLLAALTRGKTGEYPRYIALAQREWLRSRNPHTAQEGKLCWLNRIPALLRRNSTDPRVADSLDRERLGTMDAPVNRADTPSALMAPVAVGLFYDQQRLNPGQIGTLAAEAAALVCGAPEAFLSGAAVAYIIAGILQAPELPLSEQFMQTATIIRSLFGKRYPQAEEVAAAISQGVRASRLPQQQLGDVMEDLKCVKASQCLAGAVYACLAHPDSFDEALVTAVNHSGRSCATAALTGAIMGARLGADAIPEFYLETLESEPYLTTLARDLVVGNTTTGLFNDSWDQKYSFGMPV